MEQQAMKQDTKLGNACCRQEDAATFRGLTKEANTGYKSHAQTTKDINGRNI